MLNYKTLKEKSIKELNALKSDLRRKAMNLRFQKTSGDSAVNLSEFKKVRRDIARINTSLRSRFIPMENDRRG